MTSAAEFSWGVNPRSIESEIIDLGADPAYIVVSSEKLIVNSIDQKGFQFIFSGYWADDKTPGSLSVLFGIDGDTLYYLQVEPEYRSGLIDNGEHGWFVRVPVDAPIVEIGPEGP